MLLLNIPLLCSLLYIDGSVCVSKGGRYDDLVDKFREGFKVCTSLCIHVTDLYTVCMHVHIHSTTYANIHEV